MKDAVETLAKTIAVLPANMKSPPNTLCRCLQGEQIILQKLLEAKEKPKEHIINQHFRLAITQLNNAGKEKKKSTLRYNNELARYCLLLTDSIDKKLHSTNPIYQRILVELDSPTPNYVELAQLSIPPSPKA